MLKFSRLLLATLLTSLFLCGPVKATPVDLYAGEVPVESQQPNERRKALPLALMQVLQKLSGLRVFDEYPLVAEALDNADSMVMSFHYRNHQQTLTDGNTQNELRLIARFSENAVNDLVQELQLPLWQPDRGGTEIWVVVDSGLERQIFPVEFQYAWDAMDAAAAGRGLPVFWPQADEDGQYAVNEQILWGGYTEDLIGSGRGGVMVAAARREGAEWSVRINLAYNDQSWTWRNSDIDLQFLLSESIQQSADLVAAANTIAASDQSSGIYQVTVGGIRGSDDYSRCLAYLEGLSVVERVSVESARSGQVRYRLELKALPQYLEDMLATGNVLEPGDTQGSYQLNR